MPCGRARALARVCVRVAAGDRVQHGNDTEHRIRTDSIPYDNYIDCRVDRSYCKQMVILRLQSGIGLKRKAQNFPLKCLLLMRKCLNRVESQRMERKQTGVRSA